MKNSIKTLIGAFAVIGVASTGTMLSSKAFAQDQEKGEKTKDTPMTKPMAKITPVQALKAAEAKVGGKATMAIFEFDEGHWIYGVIVAKNHKLMEVDVDPMTGKAGASEDVTPDDEAKEMKDALEKMTK
jgi:uncharacterized membrane protein YkoI